MLVAGGARHLGFRGRAGGRDGEGRPELLGDLHALHSHRAADPRSENALAGLERDELGEDEIGGQIPGAGKERRCMIVVDVVRNRP